METPKKITKETIGRRGDRVDRFLNLASREHATFELTKTFTPEQRDHFNKLKAELLALFKGRDYETIKAAQETETLKRIGEKLEQMQRFVQDKRIPLRINSREIDDQSYTIDIGSCSLREVKDYNGRFWCGCEAKGRPVDVSGHKFFIDCEGNIRSYQNMIFRFGDQLYFVSHSQGRGGSILSRLTDESGKEIRQAAGMVVLEYDGQPAIIENIHGYFRITYPSGAAYDFERVVWSELKIPPGHDCPDATFLHVAENPTSFWQFVTAANFPIDKGGISTHLSDVLLYRGKKISPPNKGIVKNSCIEYQGTPYYVISNFWHRQQLCAGREKVGKTYREIGPPLVTDEGLRFVAKTRSGAYIINEKGERLTQKFATIEAPTVIDGQFVCVVTMPGKLEVRLAAYPLNKIFPPHYQTLKVDGTIREIKKINDRVYVVTDQEIFLVGRDIIYSAEKGCQINQVFEAGQELYSLEKVEPGGVHYKFVRVSDEREIDRALEFPHITSINNHLVMVAQSVTGYHLENELKEKLAPTYDQVFSVKRIDDKRFYVIGRRGTQVVKEIFEI